MSGKSAKQDEKQQKIVKLKQMLEDDQLLVRFPTTDDDILERFLGGTSYDLNEAFQRIKLLHELLIEAPKWCTVTGPLNKKELVDSLIRVAIPRTDREGRPIYVVKLGNVDPSKCSLLDVITVDDIWLEYILLNNPAEKGLCIIMDIKNLPWRSIKWLTPESMKTGLKKFQGLPFKDYRIHVINESMIVHAAIKLMWPFLPQYLKNMVKFHFADRESFFKHVDPENLPSEYGGYDLDIDYSQILEQLHNQHDKIFDSLKKQRTLKILE